MTNEFNFALHPGRIILRYLKELNMKQNELSKLTNVNKTIINEIIKGKRKVTYSLSEKFSKVFDMQPDYFYAMQLDYDKAMCRIKSESVASFDLESKSTLSQKIFADEKREMVSKIYSCAV